MYALTVLSFNNLPKTKQSQFLIAFDSFNLVHYHFEMASFKFIKSSKKITYNEHRLQIAS